MVFIPTAPHRWKRDNAQNKLLLTSYNVKKVVVKDMDFIIKSFIISDEEIYIDEKLNCRIERAAQKRVVIDYQILPYSVDGYYINRYIVLVTCKKGRYD